jgi:enoyl-CoA hydratase/carnithine racemase
MNSTEQKILTRLKNGVFTITLNNPSKLNCIGFDMLYGLDAAIAQAVSDENIKVVMLQGAGDRAFSSGADLNEFRSLTREKANHWIEYGNEVFNKLEKLAKPTVAYIHGYAIGGGLELALACDFRIASNTAVLYSPELQHGWLPGWGGMTRLRRLIGEAKAKEIVMLCAKNDAQASLQYGLLTKVIASEIELNTLLEHLKSLNSNAFCLAKTALMDEGRSTAGVDVQFDVLAMQIAREE